MIMTSLTDLNDEAMRLSIPSSVGRIPLGEPSEFDVRRKLSAIDVSMPSWVVVVVARRQVSLGTVVTG